MNYQNQTIENELQSWKVFGILKPNNLDVLSDLLIQKYPNSITLLELSNFLLTRHKDAEFWYNTILEVYPDYIQFEEENN
jgi:hypothetical protein